MNYQETLNYIHSLGMFSKEASLERITALLKKLGNPQNSFDSVHIAGTNGKGSVAAFTSSVFQKAGLKTALFTSPFIVDFCERIQINGDFIPRKTLCRLAAMVKDANIEVTEFEFITAVAFLYFAEEKCDIAVIETGLGGRLDATNTLSRVKVSVITKIGLDHMAILGDTVSEIAAEKCGIIKNGVTVSSPSQPKDAYSVIQKCAKELCVPDLQELKIINSDLSGNEFLYKGNKYRTALIGKHQIENAVTAIETLKAAGITDKKCIYKGLETAHIPARLEVASQKPLMVIDGAHNKDGALVLSEFLKRYEGEVTAVIGVMKDKDYKNVLRTTLPICKRVITTSVTDNPRSLDTQTLMQEAKAFCNEVYAANSVEEAINLAKEKCENGPVFIFGSLYLVSVARSILI